MSTLPALLILRELLLPKTLRTFGVGRRAYMAPTHGLLLLVDLGLQLRWLDELCQVARAEVML